MFNNFLTEISWTLRQGSVLAPILALFAGIITSLTPCSMSSVPLIIGYVGGTGAKDTKRLFFLSLTFAIGMTITFSAIGIASAYLQRVVSTVGVWWYFFIGILMILMAIQFWGIHYFIHPTNFVNKSKKKGYIGALISGLLGGLFSSPCATPVMIALMSMISGTGGLENVNALWGLLLFLLFAIGHSLIVILAGTLLGFVGQLNGKTSYKWFTKISTFVLGLLIFALGIYFLYIGFEGLYV